MRLRRRRRREQGRMDPDTSPNRTATRFVMCQLGHIAPVMAAALMLSASVGCNSTEKKDAAPVEPPVMGRSEEQDALAKAQVPMGKQGEVDRKSVV